MKKARVEKNKCSRVRGLRKVKDSKKQRLQGSRAAGASTFSLCRFEVEAARQIIVH